MSIDTETTETTTPTTTPDPAAVVETDDLNDSTENDADREAERKRADRLVAESFGAGSTLRSPEFIDGFRARLYFSFAGDPISNPHSIGTAQADAFFSGIDYGRIVAHMQG